MSNGNANTHVTTVNLKDDDTMDIIVQFDGFYSGELVEISGYVTQIEGAYSSFYLQTPVPSDPSLPPGTVQVPVTIKKMNGLLNDRDMTVVTKVAKVWPTVLTANKSNPATPPPGSYTTLGSGAVTATWTAKPPPKGANW